MTVIDRTTFVGKKIYTFYDYIVKAFESKYKLLSAGKRPALPHEDINELDYIYLCLEHNKLCQQCANSSNNDEKKLIYDAIIECRNKMLQYQSQIDIKNSIYQDRIKAAKNKNDVSTLFNDFSLMQLKAAILMIKKNRINKDIKDLKEEYEYDEQLRKVSQYMDNDTQNDLVNINRLEKIYESYDKELNELYSKLNELYESESLNGNSR